MLSSKQIQKIWYLSDAVLYPEAVRFIRAFGENEREALPNSQVIGLLNVTNTARYFELDRFIKHQRDRDWQPSKRHLKVFYTDLHLLMTSMKNKRVRSEFHLVSEDLSTKAMIEQIDELMERLAREFIQHLVAENRLIDLQLKEQKRAQRGKY